MSVAASVCELRNRDTSESRANLFNRAGTDAMTVYVAEIKGRGVAAFHANTDLDAESFACDRGFRDDLMVLTTGGFPLWDGMTSIKVRQASPLEEAKWQRSRAKAIRHGNIEQEDDAWIAFLVALTHPDRRSDERGPHT